MEINTIENPFTGCTARDMTYDEISRYWCSPFELYELNEAELFSSRTPIIIEGARGTGKTMLLKHLSYYIQRDFAEEKNIASTLGHFSKVGVGVYFRYKEDFCNMFTRIGCSLDDRRTIFAYYYELFISRQIVEILRDIYEEKIDINQEKEYVHCLCGFLESDVDNFKGLYDVINQKIQYIDGMINDSMYETNWVDAIVDTLQVNDLVKRIVNTVCTQFDGWEDIQFNILLDEYENARDYQKMINTLIKQVDNTLNLSYRIGMRPEGMFDNKTYVAGECIQVDRDFILCPLKCLNHETYKRFALDVASKRLANVDYYKNNNLLDIRIFLGENEDLDKEAASIARDKRHFRLLQRIFNDENEIQRVINEISCDEKLMEMYNIIRVVRGTDYRDIGRSCKEYQKLRKEKKLKEATGEVKKYYLDYSNKYRMTLLYVLLAIYKKDKMYYSLNTYLYLSSGSINDFISLCRNVFYFIDNTKIEEIKKGNIISAKVQTEAAIRTANNQLRKVAMSNNYGREMNSFIDNTGRIFGYYHKDLEAKYPETNQFAFDDENAIYQDEELNRYVLELINTGAIIKPDKQQNISVGKKKGYVYKLNRIFAPIFQFSYRTRGGYNLILSKEDFRAMLFTSVDPQKYVGKNAAMNQISMFEYMYSEEVTNE